MSSGTYNFTASNGEIVLAAYEPLQIRAPSIRQEHMYAALSRTELAVLPVEQFHPQSMDRCLHANRTDAGSGDVFVNPADRHGVGFVYRLELRVIERIQALHHANLTDGVSELREPADTRTTNCVLDG